jgi:hypothetical protein
MRTFLADLNFEHLVIIVAYIEENLPAREKDVAKDVASSERKGVSHTTTWVVYVLDVSKAEGEERVVEKGLQRQDLHSAVKEFLDRLRIGFRKTWVLSTIQAAKTE